jgi:dihydroorotase
MSTLAIRGGRVVSTASIVRDVFVRDGRFTGSVGLVDVVHDVAGALVLPGLVDLTARVSLRATPEDEPALSTVQRALRGGFTSAVVGDLRRGDKEGDPVDVVRGLRQLQQAALDHRGTADVFALAPLTRQGAGGEPADIHRGAEAGAVVFGDVDAHDDAEVLRRAFELVAGVDGLVIAPAFDARLSRQGIAVEGPVATRLGLPGFPAATAEAIGIARLVELARLSGVRLHITGVSTARGLKVVEAAVADGVHVTADVRPWSVLLDDEAWLRRPYDTALRVWPPLSRPADREVLADAVERGVVAIGVGHSPPPPRLKALEVDVATPGAATYDTVVGVLLGRFSPEVVVHALATLPAKVLQQPSGIVDGGVAHAAVVRIGEGNISSGLFAGLRSGGDVVTTISHGRVFERISSAPAEGAVRTSEVQQ